MKIKCFAADPEFFFSIFNWTKFVTRSFNVKFLTRNYNNVISCFTRVAI